MEASIRIISLFSRTIRSTTRMMTELRLAVTGPDSSLKKHACRYTTSRLCSILSRQSISMGTCRRTSLPTGVNPNLNSEERRSGSKLACGTADYDRETPLHVVIRVSLSEKSPTRGNAALLEPSRKSAFALPEFISHILPLSPAPAASVFLAHSAGVLPWLSNQRL